MKVTRKWVADCPNGWSLYKELIDGEPSGDAILVDPQKQDRWSGPWFTAVDFHKRACEKGDFRGDCMAGFDGMFDGISHEELRRIKSKVDDAQRALAIAIRRPSGMSGMFGGYVKLEPGVLSGFHGATRYVVLDSRTGLPVSKTALTARMVPPSMIKALREAASKSPSGMSVSRQYGIVMHKIKSRPKKRRRKKR